MARVNNRGLPVPNKTATASRESSVKFLQQGARFACLELLLKARVGVKATGSVTQFAAQDKRK